MDAIEWAIKSGEIADSSVGGDAPTTGTLLQNRAYPLR